VLACLKRYFHFGISIVKGFRFRGSAGYGVAGEGGTSVATVKKTGKRNFHAPLESG
jgi:hypothetical protein